MRSAIPSSRGSDEEDKASDPPYCWWRSASGFNQSAVKVEFSRLSSLTPRQRLFREFERLAVLAEEGVDELRHKLLTYRPGDFWVPTGGISKEDMNIPPTITLLLVGFSGCGKSSVINLMYSVLGRSGLIPFAQTSATKGSSSHTPMYMQEHNVLRSMRNGFCVYDARGFEYNRMNENIEELSHWMSEGIHHKQLCLRSADEVPIKELNSGRQISKSSSQYTKRVVNYVMVVVNLAEIFKALKESDLKPLEATKEIFSSSALRKCNENPILILTHGDKLSAEERIDCRLKICEYLGISETTGVYDVVCLTEYGFLADETDRVTAYALTEAVYRALLISDRGHAPKKKVSDLPMIILSWLLLAIATLFSLLADLFSRISRSNRLRY
ncbi:hypothetical protein RJ641_030828 [Dillenia turbinata]|uniref:G domain-containing protein n=1 Tax=Dillenia turbinata TaxID=194707 RepID=A0AAN8ZKC4_9MAGN